jgi:hypothetical protein
MQIFLSRILTSAWVVMLWMTGLILTINLVGLIGNPVIEIET